MAIYRDKTYRDYKDKQKWDETGRVCSVCSVFKSWDEYSWKRSKEYKDKSPKINQIKQPKCKNCAHSETKAWREKQSPERLKHLYLTNTYGLSYKDFTDMLELQEYRCRVCSRTLEVSIEARQLKASSAVVDHDHITGKVRGILCNECNRGLGYFHDNKESLMNAIKYLTEQEQCSEGGL